MVLAAVCQYRNLPWEVGILYSQSKSAVVTASSESLYSTPSLAEGFWDTNKATQGFSF